LKLTPKDLNGANIGANHTVTVTDGDGHTYKAVWNSNGHYYEVTLSETRTGTYSFTAKVDGRTLSGNFEVSVKAGPVDGGTSTVTSPDVNHMNSDLVVTVVPKDAYGNPMGPGQTVTVTNGDGKTLEATWSSKAGGYTAVYSKLPAGTYTFSATVNSVRLTQTSRTIVKGQLLPSDTTIHAPAVVSADDGQVTVTVVPVEGDTKNASYESPLGSGHNVVVYDNKGKKLTASWNAARQAYLATFTETVAGNYTYHAIVDGEAITHTASVTVTPGVFDPATSTILIPSTLTANGQLTVRVIAKDKHGNLLTSSHVVKVSDGAGHQEVATWNVTHGDYEAKFTETKAGPYHFTPIVDGGVQSGPFSSNSTDSLVVKPGSVSTGQSSMVSPGSVTAGDSITVKVVPRDGFGNELGSGHTVTVSDGSGHTLTATWNAAQENYEAVFSGDSETGAYTFTGKVDGIAINETSTTTVVPAVTSALDSTVTAPSAELTGNPITVKVGLKDSYGNSLGSGHTVTVSDGGTPVSASWNSNDDDYEASLTESAAGTYAFHATVDGTALSETAVTVVSWAPAPGLSQTPGASQGSLIGTTTVTAHPNQAGDSLLYVVSSTSVSTPLQHDAAPTGSGVHTNGNNLMVVPGDYVGIYEVNSSNMVVSFSQIEITTGEITPPTIQDTAADNGTYVTNVNNTTGTMGVNVAYDTTVSELTGSVESTDGSTLSYQVMDNLGNPLSGSTALTSGDKLVVTASNGKTVSTYSIAVAKDPNTAIVSTNASYVTSVSSTSPRSVDVSFGTTATELEGAIASTDSSAQTYQVVASDGTTPVTGALSTGNELIVTAADGTTKDIYTIKVDISQSGSTMGATPPILNAGDSVTVTVIPKDSSGGAITGSTGVDVKVTDTNGTTVPAVWNSSNSDYEATFTESGVGNVGFSATVNGTLMDNTASVQVQPGNIGNPDGPTLLPPTGGTQPFKSSITTPTDHAVQVPNYSAGKSTLTGAGQSAADIGNTGTDVGFYYLSQFPTTALASFNQPVVESNNYDSSNNITSPGHAGQIWVDDGTSPADGLEGGSGTPNGLTFYTAMIDLPTTQDVTFTMPSPDDIALAWVDGAPVVYNTDISGYNSGWSLLGVNMPPATNTVQLSAGVHQIVLEAANAFHPGTGNQAGVGLTVQDSQGKTLLDTTSSYLSQWKSTGFVTQLPIFWYDTAGTYDIYQEMLNPTTLVVSNTAQWTIYAGTQSSVTSIADTAADNGAVVMSIDNTAGSLSVTSYSGKTVSQLIGALQATDGSAQTYAITDSSGNTLSGSTSLADSDKLVVKASEGSTATYSISLSV